MPDDDEYEEEEADIAKDYRDRNVMDRNEDDDDCDGDEIEDGNDNDNDDDDVDCSTANSVDEGLHKTVSTRTPSGNKNKEKPTRSPRGHDRLKTTMLPTTPPVPILTTTNMDTTATRRAFGGSPDQTENGKTDLVVATSVSCVLVFTVLLVALYVFYRRRKRRRIGWGNAKLVRDEIDEEIPSNRHDEQDGGNIYDHLNHSDHATEERTPPTITHESEGDDGYRPQLPARGENDKYPPSTQNTYTQLDKTLSDEHRYLQIDLKIHEDNARQTNSNSKDHEYFTLEPNSPENGNNSADGVNPPDNDNYEKTHEYFVLEPTSSGSGIDCAQITADPVQSNPVTETKTDHEYFVLEPNNTASEDSDSGNESQHPNEIYTDHEYQVLEPSQ
ncbi:hypothetical protein ScPMuIL_009430 [Solemya velum]